MDGSQDQTASVGGEADGEEAPPIFDVPVPEHRVASPLRFRAWTMPEGLITVPDADHAYGAPATMLDYNLDEEDCEFLEKERADRRVYLDQSGLFHLMPAFLIAHEYYGWTVKKPLVEIGSWWATIYISYLLPRQDSGISQFPSL